MAVGYNNFDVDAMTAAGVQGTNTPDVLTDTTADFGFALLMGTAVPGFASTMAVMTFLLAIVIALLSLVVEYLSRIFYLLSSQPEVVIESIYD